MSLYIFIVLFIVIFILVQNKVVINFKSFFHKGLKVKRGKWGTYCYDGKQGTGKTMAVVQYLIENKDKSLYFCNIPGISNVDYTFFTGFSGLIKIKHDLDNGSLVIPKGKQLVIVYDEIFTELQKHSKLNSEVMDFLCQMRKRKIIFLTTAQEWAEIPLTFRRFCRYQVHCSMFNLFPFSLSIKLFRDAENMKWDDTEQEFVAPIIKTSISKVRKDVANSYDTFMRISPVAADTSHISSDRIGV